MARKTHEDVLEGAEGIDIKDNDERQIEDALSEISVNSSKFKLHKKDRKNKYAFVTDYQPDQFSVEDVKEEYGGGEYRVVVFGVDGKYMTRKDFQIDERIKGRLDNPQQLGTMQNMEMFSLMFQSSKEQSAAQKESSDRALTLSRESSDKTMQMFMGMMQMMQQQGQQTMQMMVAMIGGMNQRKGESSIDELVKLKMAFPDNNEKIMEMFTRGLEAGRDAKEDPWWQDVLKGIAPTLLPTVAGMLPQRRATVAVEPARANNRMPTDSGNLQTPPEDMNMKLMMEAQATVKMIENAAVFKLDIAETADKLIAKAENLQIIDQGLTFLRQDNWFEQVTAKIPPFNVHKEYLMKLRTEILKQYETVDDTVIPPPNS